MSKHKTTGFDDGFHGRQKDKPHDILDLAFTGPKDMSRKNDANKEYTDAYYEGRRERDKRK